MKDETYTKSQSHKSWVQTTCWIQMRSCQLASEIFDVDGRETNYEKRVYAAATATWSHTEKDWVELSQHTAVHFSEDLPSQSLDWCKTTDNKHKYKQ